MWFFSGKSAAHRASGFADDEFRLDVNSFGITNLFRIRNSFQQSIRRDFAHSAQRLANCRQTGILKRSALNVVEADDGNIFRDSAASFSNRANRADCSHVVESEERREFLAGGEKPLRHFISE